MDDFDSDMLAIWRRELAETKHLVSRLKSRPPSRVSDQADIARLDAECVRLVALIAAYEAEAVADAKRPLDVNRRAKRMVDSATGDTTDD